MPYISLWDISPDSAQIAEFRTVGILGNVVEGHLKQSSTRTHTRRSRLVLRGDTTLFCVHFCERALRACPACDVCRDEVNSLTRRACARERVPCTIWGSSEFDALPNFTRDRVSVGARMGSCMRCDAHAQYVHVHVHVHVARMWRACARLFMSEA